jgi:spermidine synthase
VSRRRTKSQGGSRDSHTASKSADRVRVVVRGGKRTLRIDGSYASTWEPGSETTGSVWDGIAAGLLALPPERRRSVLLLGIGGGSAARVVRAVAPRARIVGVEIDPEVVRAARQWFELDALGVEAVVDDAARFLARTRRRFDAVLEDVFMGDVRSLRKPPGFPLPAFDHVRRILRPGGVAVSNTLDEAAEVRAVLAERFARQVRIEIEDYENQIWVASDGPLDAIRLRAATAADPVLRASLGALSFRSFRSAR